MYRREDIRALAARIHAALMAAQARNKEQGDESPVTATVTADEINKALGRKRLGAAIRSLLISDLLTYPELECLPAEGRDLMIRTVPSRVLTKFASLTDLKEYVK